MNKKTIIIICSLLIGAIIYFLSGSDAYITFGLNDGVRVITNSFVINYIPDFLWAVAFVLTLSFFLDNMLTAGILVVLFGTIFEALQRYNIIKGTCDVLDIVVEAVGVILMIVFVKGDINEKQ
ncbi:MAG: hypothetical protein IKG47_11570 [Oscillospiraceae bacterium]|nr:hypothetical protein [Oscillospiraceae bacterium]